MKAMNILILFCISSIFSQSAICGSKYDLGPKITPEAMAANGAKQRKEEKERDFAKGACINYIKKHLNDPDSAEFPIGDVERRLHAIGVKQKTGKWKVTFSGRARNQFNALVLAKFQCIVMPVMYEGQQNMQIVSSKQLDR